TSAAYHYFCGRRSSVCFLLAILVFIMSWMQCRYNAKVHPHLPKLSSLLSGLSQRSLLQPKVVIIHSIPNSVSDRTGWDREWVSWETFLSHGKTARLGCDLHGE